MDKVETLTTAEEQRVDQLLVAARRFNYSSIVIAGVLAALALEGIDSPKFILPFLQVELPILKASLVMYLLVFSLSVLADKMFRMTYPYMLCDSRRPPFPWIPLSRRVSYWSVTGWVLLPPIVSGIFVSMITADQIGYQLAIIAPLASLVPRIIGNYWPHIIDRSDERGGPATLSIYLLYWYRVLRNFVIIGLMVIPIIAISPEWRVVLERARMTAAIIMASGIAVRIICGLPFVYRLIDRLGAVFGFPQKSEHYK